jgi:hypothetical protein
MTDEVEGPSSKRVLKGRTMGLNRTTGLKEEGGGREGARPPDPHRGVRTSSAACRGQHRLGRDGGDKNPMVYY